MVDPVALKNKLSKIRREAEERDTKHRSETLNLPYADLRKVPVSMEALKIIPEAQARKASFAAIQIKMRDLAVAVLDPRLPEAKEVLESLASQKYNVKLFIVSSSSLQQAWQSYEFVQLPVKEITGTLSIDQQRLNELLASFSVFNNIRQEFIGIDFVKTTTTTLFEIIVIGAMASKVSDVHIESLEKKSKIRFRMDGILHDVFSDIPLRSYHNLISRIKLLSGLKINVHEEAQDGRFTIRFPNQKEVEVRVSVVPAEFGETVVMRILDPDFLGVDLAALGLREDDLVFVQNTLKSPNGLILNTGPTGSGKTTTLYTFLRKVATSEIKVLTIEDPIEYRLEGIQQTQVDPDVNYTFANGLRAILRQDPDIILVGEIRDGETADIAMQAALTGHLVFSTLHTNDSLGAIPRLVDLGVRPATIGPALNVVIAQRLVRILCKPCRNPVPLTQNLRLAVQKFLASLPERVNRQPYQQFLGENSTGTLFEPKGCDVCGGVGYKGRVGIFEFLKVTPSLQDSITTSLSQSTIRAIAQKQQMITMQQDGILKTLAGITSLSELENITGPVEWEQPLS